MLMNKIHFYTQINCLNLKLHFRRFILINTKYKVFLVSSFMTLFLSFYDWNIFEVSALSILFNHQFQNVPLGLTKDSFRISISFNFRGLLFRAIFHVHLINFLDLYDWEQNTILHSNWRIELKMVFSKFHFGTICLIGCISFNLLVFKTVLFIIIPKIQCSF